ncbi:GHKL domain-containing protein [bacterium]|nr:GHKL domain-containing protein [bacterium]
MKSIVQSFKFQLLASFLVVYLVFVLAIATTSIIKAHNNKYSEYIQLLKSTELIFTKMLSQEQAFLLFTVRDDAYYKSGSSDYLLRRNTYFKELKEMLQQIKKNPFTSDAHQIDSLLQLLELHHNLFVSVEGKLREKGFKDYGLIGEMRKYIHELEYKPDVAISRVDILQLRRHEKDFLLRNSEYYAQSHEILCDRILTQLGTDSVKNHADLVLLRKYKRKFGRVCSISAELGTYDTQGLLLRLQGISRKFFEKIDEDISTTTYNYKNKSNLLQTAFYLAIAIALIIGLAASFQFARKRSHPINDLVRRINLIPIKGDNAFDNGIKYASKELNELYESFKKVFAELKQQMKLTNENAVVLETQYTELQQVNRELDQFVYSISHDLRAPLTSVMGLIELMQMENKQEELNTLIALMKNSVNKLDLFIHDILDYSRNSRQSIVVEEFNVNELVNEIFESLHYMLQDRKPDKRIGCAENTFFIGDKRRIKVILNNLISNAVKYADPEKEDAFIEVDCVVNEGRLHISVVDNGIGIDEVHLDKIFGMFYRATDKSKGSGLGLYIVNETVKVLGGQIKINSILHVGTTVTVIIPKAQQA